MSPYFGTFAVKSFQPTFDEKSKKFVKSLAKKTEKEEFNIFLDLALVTLEMILKTFGLDIDIVNMDEVERDEIVHNVNK